MKARGGGDFGWGSGGGGPNHGADRPGVGKECHLSGRSDDQGFQSGWLQEGLEKSLKTQR